MDKISAEISDLGITCWMKGMDIAIRQGAGEIVFPKARAQGVLDAILTIDFAINRKLAAEERKKGNDPGFLKKLAS